MRVEIAVIFLTSLNRYSAFVFYMWLNSSNIGKFGSSILAFLKVVLKPCRCLMLINLFFYFAFIFQPPKAYWSRQGEELRPVNVLSPCEKQKLLFISPRIAEGGKEKADRCNWGLFDNASLEIEICKFETRACLRYCSWQPAILNVFELIRGCFVIC